MILPPPLLALFLFRSRVCKETYNKMKKVGLRKEGIWCMKHRYYLHIIIALKYHHVSFLLHHEELTWSNFCRISREHGTLECFKIPLFFLLYIGIETTAFRNHSCSPTIVASKHNQGWLKSTQIANEPIFDILVRPISDTDHPYGKFIRKSCAVFFFS